MSAKCDYTSESGKPCKKWACVGDTRCNKHGGQNSQTKPASKLCSYTMPNGKPCERWAVIGTNPPLCVSHSGLTGEPKGKDNPNWRHGFYTKGNTSESLEGMIEDLFYKQDHAASVLEKIIDPEDLLRLLSMHFKNASIVGKLLRDKQMLEGDDDDLLSALGPALDLIKTRLEQEQTT